MKIELGTGWKGGTRRLTKLPRARAQGQYGSETCNSVLTILDLRSSNTTVVDGTFLFPVGYKMKVDRS